MSQASLSKGKPAQKPWDKFVVPNIPPLTFEQEQLIAHELVGHRDRWKDAILAFPSTQKLIHASMDALEAKQPGVILDRSGSIRELFDRASFSNVQLEFSKLAYLQRHLIVAHHKLLKIGKLIAEPWETTPRLALMRLHAGDIPKAGDRSEKEDQNIQRAQKKLSAWEQSMGMDVAQAFTMFDQVRELKLIREECRNRLVAPNLRWACRVARDMLRAEVGIEFNDLAAVASKGMITAVDRFDPTKGVKVASYSTEWIQQAVDRYISAQGFIYLPVYMVELQNKYDRFKAIFYAEHFRNPTIKESAQHLKISVSRAKVVIAANRLNCENVGGGNDEKGPQNNLDVLPASSKAFPNVKSLDHAQQLKLLKVVVSNVLDDRSQIIIEKRFGIGGEKPRTLIEVGQQVGLTREGVRQIEFAAIARLSDWLTVLDSSKPHLEFVLAARLGAGSKAAENFKRMIQQIHGQLGDVQRLGANEIRSAALVAHDAALGLSALYSVRSNSNEQKLKAVRSAREAPAKPKRQKVDVQKAVNVTDADAAISLADLNFTFQS